MLDIKNIPVYNEPNTFIKKSTIKHKHMDEHFKNVKTSDKSFLHNYYTNVYEGKKNK